MPTSSGDDRPDRRLGIIAEQSERLSRMVRQLLTVTRLESGAFQPKADVVALGGRVRKAWEALGADDVAFTLDDRSDGWLAIADADQLDQVLWALLDNAVKYGERRPVSVEVVAIVASPDVSQLRVTITDGGPRRVGGRSRAAVRPVPARHPADRRCDRRAGGSGLEGSGLGLYVSRELCRAMDGDLVLEPPVRRPGRGVQHLPAGRDRHGIGLGPAVRQGRDLAADRGDASQVELGADDRRPCRPPARRPFPTGR